MAYRVSIQLGATELPLRAEFETRLQAQRYVESVFETANVTLRKTWYEVVPGQWMTDSPCWNIDIYPLITDLEAIRVPSAL